MDPSPQLGDSPATAEYWRPRPNPRPRRGQIHQPRAAPWASDHASMLKSPNGARQALAVSTAGSYVCSRRAAEGHALSGLKRFFAVRVPRAAPWADESRHVVAKQAAVGRALPTGTASDRSIGRSPAGMRHDSDRKAIDSAAKVLAGKAHRTPADAGGVSTAAISLGYHPLRAGHAYIHCRSENNASRTSR